MIAFNFETFKNPWKTCIANNISANEIFRSRVSRKEKNNKNYGFFYYIF